MSEDAKYTCGFCGSKTEGDDGFIYCPYCGEPYDVKGYEPSHPMPCVRDEHGEINEQTVKQLFAKINEELDELKEAVFVIYQIHSLCSQYGAYKPGTQEESIAEEAADTITAITTLCEALGINAAMRDEAIRQVNHKNFSRGRL